MRKIGFVLSLAVLALAVMAGCEPAQPEANVDSGARKVAVFEGGEVTLSEVQEFAQQSGLGEVDPGSPQFEQVAQQIVPQLVDLEVAKAYAQERGITVSEEEVDREIETIKDQIHQQAQAQGQDISREEAFDQALRQAGLTEEELRRQIRENLPVQKVQERVAGDAEPSRQQVERFYEENKESQYTTPAQRCVRHILFNKDQEQRAEEVAQQLRDGDGNFADLAKEFSQDPGSAEQGGDLGCIGRGETVPNFEEAVFGAGEGEIVGPVETQFGYHVIEVTDVREESTRPLEEVEGEIRQQLASEQRAQEFTEWLQKQKERRDVKYLEGFEPAS